VPTPHLSGGWQVFHGCHLRGESQHGIKRPMIMDATVGQSGAFRFVYVLPLSEHEALIEDTYYQTRSSLDEEDVDRRLARYIGRLRWPHELVGVESGALPVIAGGDFDAWQAERRVEGVARAGAHAGFLHPLTGYTLPFAVQTALAVAQAADLSGPALAALLEKRARAHWRATRFYRTLGSLLFGAAQPNERWRVFQRFYRLPRGPIERFYAGRSTWLDKVRIVTGKPPVPVRRAMFALFTSRPRLKKAA
jgi:lycopene beta-cyclase